jgi:Rod binding domain-containing protein
MALLPAHAAAPAPKAADPQKQRQLANAARQFEGIMMQQLVKVLWKTSGTAKGGQGEMYQGMFEGAFADQLVSGGGIGLAGMLEKALSGQATTPSSSDITPALAQVLGTTHRLQLEPLAVATSESAFLEPNVGKTAQLQAAASDMLATGGEQWSKAGSLGAQDLRSELVTQTPGGAARFSVRDANGYQGYNKCNLFAFELARRAGFEVPVVARDAGWGFPSAGAVAHDAGDRQVQGGWAHVVTGESAERLDAAAKAGTRAFLLAGSGVGQAHGHMAVVERVHAVEYGADGAISRVVFDGWEARPGGGGHLVRRTWNVAGHNGGHDPRNGFQDIQILELQRAPQGAASEVPLSSAAAASALDDQRSSQVTFRPNSGRQEEL